MRCRVWRSILLIALLIVVQFNFMIILLRDEDKEIGPYNMTNYPTYVEVFIQSGSIDQDRLIEDVNALGGRPLKTFTQIQLLLVELPFSKVARLTQRNGVEVLPNRVYHGCLDQSVEIIKPAASWTILESEFGYSIIGTGINISIVDTGINANHWDLDDLDDNPATTDPKILAEWDFVNDDPLAMDDYGHGTHIAGIVAGTGNRSSGLYTGVAPGANLLNAKVLDDQNSGTADDIIDGVIWSVEHGAHVINLSLASTESGNGTDPLSLAVDWAVKQGVTVVISSGYTSGFYHVGKPGVSNLGITVGATDDGDAILALGGYGPTLDFRLKPEICAPGDEIASCRAGLTPDLTIGSPINDYYTRVSGTSQATAHVSGVVALLLQAHPDWTPVEVRKALLGNAKELGDDIYQRGAGRVDAVASTNASILIDPIIDLQLFGGNISYVTELPIENLENHAVQCTFTTDATINITPNPLSIPALSTRTINLTYTPTAWEAFHHESVVRIAHDGKESRLFLCHIFPKCSFEAMAASISYNDTFWVAGNLTLDQYIQTDLVNLSLEIHAGQVRLGSLPITTTELTYNFTNLKNASLYRGVHPLQVQIVQNGELKVINGTDLTVQGWAASMVVGELTVRRGATARLAWSLIDPEEFEGAVSVSILVDGDWLLLGTSTTGYLDVAANYPPADYQLRLEFLGDPIHLPKTSTTTLHILSRDFNLLYGILAIFAIIGITGYILYRIRKRQPPPRPREGVDAILGRIAAQPPPPPPSEQPLVGELDAELLTEDSIPPQEPPLGEAEESEPDVLADESEFPSEPDVLEE